MIIRWGKRHNVQDVECYLKDSIQDSEGTIAEMFLSNINSRRSSEGLNYFPVRLSRDGGVVT